MKTKSPCWKDGDDCPRRYIGCRAECEEWHKFLIEHAAEKEMIRKKKDADDRVNEFLVNQGKRTRNLNQIRRVEERTKGVKKL